MSTPVRAARHPTGRLPGRVQQAVRAATERGETPSGPLGVIEGEGDVLWLPDVARRTGPLTVLGRFGAVIGLSALALGTVLWTLGSAPALLVLAAGGITVLVGAVLGTVDLVLARRGGQRRFGLILTPDLLVIWGPGFSRVAPRSAVERVLSDAARPGRPLSVDVTTKDGLERWPLQARPSPALVALLARWHQDQRPWQASGPRRR